MSKVLAILGELGDRDIDWMLSIGQHQQILAGTTLIYEGQAIDALYIVLEGTLSVSAAALGGREIGTITAGEVLGEMSFVDGRLPSASVVALQDSLVLSIPRPQLMDKLEQDVLFSLRFYRAITKFLSTRLRGTVTRFGEETHLHPEANQSDISSAGLEPEAVTQLRFEELMTRLKGTEYRSSTDMKGEA